MAQKLTKKELKTLKNALGKQGITMEEHETAQNAQRPVEVLQVDCFTMEPGEQDGWYVGYGVEYNGVGISAAEVGPASSTSSDSGDFPPENREIADESSGFDSDPPTDDEEPRNVQNRRESDDVSDKGQLLYGVDEQFYVDKGLTARNVTVHDAEFTRSYRTGDLVTTNRFEVSKSSEPDDEIHHGYQMINDDAIPCITSHSDDSDDNLEPSDDVTTSSGLWCNFVIALKDLERVEKLEKLEIPEEKLKTIPLDNEKLAQISAAMANFKLPTPPGWEGVSDSKILDFIRQRV